MRLDDLNAGSVLRVTWTAYVDESMRQRHDGSGLYVLAAVVFEAAEAEKLREAARQLAKGRRRFHWRYEEPADRRKAVGVVADLDALHVIVVGVGLDNARQERGRRQCLTRLLWELDQQGVVQVWLDARRPKQNSADLALLAALRARRILGPNLRMDFALAGEEPLAWLPDVVAGTASAAHGEGEFEYLTPLNSTLTGPLIIELD